MSALTSFILILVVTGLAFAGGETSSSRVLLGVILPYGAMVVFLTGLSYRVLKWANSAVPFHIPTTCGQQKSLRWIKSSWIESPHSKFGVAVRMALEILLFRSLFRNSRAQLRPDGPRLLYAENKWLWLSALAFHWSLLIILLRHLRFFVVPVPHFILGMDAVDGFFQFGAPQLLVTDVLIVAALLFLLLRRFTDPKVHYISLFSDYLALFLLLGIAVSGIFMRYFFKVDLEGVKQLALGLVTFSPTVPASIGALFFVHLTLVSFLLAYFPFSKLVHMGGIFLSPTRNLANDSRMVRHVNPWDYPVKVHTYQEWEDEFHDKIKAAGLPLERE
ncbi:MAG: sulfate reduction electron transfer complex DsrMKJOP subunit DsrM [Acidobacteriota bacterium]